MSPQVHVYYVVAERDDLPLGNTRSPSEMAELRMLAAEGRAPATPSVRREVAKFFELARAEEFVRELSSQLSGERYSVEGRLEVVDAQHEAHRSKLLQKSLGDAARG